MVIHPEQPDKWSFIVVSKEPVSKPYKLTSRWITIIIIVITCSAGGFLYASLSIGYSIFHKFFFKIEQNRHVVLFQSLTTLSDSIGLIIKKTSGCEDVAFTGSNKSLYPLPYNGKISPVAFNRTREIKLNQFAKNNQFATKRNGYEFTTEPSFVCPTTGRISSRFGMRADPIFEGTALHKGIDIANKEGTEVLAAADGVVIFAGNRPLWGNAVVIRHFNSSYLTIYAHLKSTHVSNNDTVYQRQVIGFIGSTGKSTGPHLHYEMHFLDEAINPLVYLFPADTVAE